ncbi:MAG: hydrogenase maturation protease [Bacteroidales bacterium]|nr:hydrogenase maturation protease [Bacteroidales bacterium]
MPDLLKKIVSAAGRKKLFVGIGNVLKCDDGIGVYISNRIVPADDISVLTVETSIENYIGKINSIDPDILVLIDAVDMGASPGTSKTLSINRIQDLTFNTHSISLARFSIFFKMEIFIVGIQPEKIEFGENISYLVQDEADRLIDIINKKQ